MRDDREIDATAVWDDSWRSLTATQTAPPSGPCAGKTSEWVVMREARTVNFSGCSFNRVFSTTYTLTPEQLDSLLEALQAVVRSSAACVTGGEVLRLKPRSDTSQRLFEEAAGACASTGTRVEGLSAVVNVLSAATPQPMWNPAMTSFKVSSRVVFGMTCTASSVSTWSVDLSRSQLLYSACKPPAFVSGSRVLTDHDAALLRTALENVWRSSRTVCGADKAEQLLEVAGADGTATTWADSFYGCRTEWDATFVDGLDGVTAVLRDLSQ